MPVQYDTQDSYFGVQSYSDVFYRSNNIIDRPLYKNDKNKDILFKLVISLTPLKDNYERIKYGFFNLLGEIGGV